MTLLNRSRDESLALLNEYTASDSLLKHAFAVEAAMRFYAEMLGEDAELWGQTGLLHDFDYEQFPNPEEKGHPYAGSVILRDLGYPEVMIEAIMGHALYTGVPRTTLLAKYLFACDELSGLVTASVLVRPDKSVHNLEVASVKKKMKDKAFARGVSREDITLGCQEIGRELDEHIGNVILALRKAAPALGLNGS